MTHGTYETVDARPALRFERRLPHPVERVWRALTEPTELAHWFPAAVTVDLRAGGEMSFDFGDGTVVGGEVTEFDPPRVFAFWWGSEHLRFEVEPEEDGQGCRLRLVDVLEERDAAARNAAGWHVCLDRFEERLGGGARRPGLRAHGRVARPLRRVPAPRAPGRRARARPGVAGLRLPRAVLDRKI